MKLQWHTMAGSRQQNENVQTDLATISNFVLYPAIAHFQGGCRFGRAAQGFSLLCEAQQVQSFDGTASVYVY